MSRLLRAVHGRVDPEFRRTLASAFWVALIPGAILFAVMQVIGYRDYNAIGVDSHAYWMAVNFPDTWYSLPPTYQDAYLYSPAFAQAIWPLGQLSWPVFQVAWGLIGVSIVVWLLAPLGWFKGLVLAPFFVTEIMLGNVYLLFAASLVLGIQRNSAFFVTPLLTKVFPGVVALWFVVRRDWRSVGYLAAATVVVVGLSAAFAPGAWVRWVEFLLSSADSSRGWFAMIRFVLAAALVVYAARTDRAWLLAPALILACPVLGGWSPVCVLGAIPRLRQWQRSQAVASDLATELATQNPPVITPAPSAQPA